MVDISFSRLTERLYRSTPWPPAAAISPLVDSDAVFLLLYKELTFRHLHACCAGSVTLRDRAASWDNYRALFEIVLNANLNVRLPPSWLWDVVDEFCYQFQAFHQARSRAEAAATQGGSAAGGGAGGAKAVSSLDTDDLRGPAGAAWPARDVARYLSDLTAKAALDDDALSSPAGAAAFAAADGGSGADGKGSNVLRVLGLFARLGLARVRCCLGDYEGSLEALGAALNPMMLSSSSSSSSSARAEAAAAASSSSSSSPSSASASATAAALASVVPNRHLYTLKVAGAHVCLHYYCGFSYLMLGRYVDAARTLDAALEHVARVKQFHARSQGYDALLKKNEQCAALLALALALCPGAAGGGFVGSGGGGNFFNSASSSSRLSDAAVSALREKHADKVARMSRSAYDASWEDLFAYGCPKFVPTDSSTAASGEPLPPPPAGGGSENANAAQAAYRAQLRAFLGVVASRRHLPPLRQLLRIYTKASLPKLTALMNSASANAAAAANANGGTSAATASSSSDPNAAPLSVDELREALHQLVASQTCVTWCGPSGVGPEKGAPLQGCAVDVELKLSTDPATGEELVEVLSSESSGAEGNSANSPAELASGVEALARQIDAISGVVRDLAALPPLVV